MTAVSDESELPTSADDASTRPSSSRGTASDEEAPNLEPAHPDAFPASKVEKAARPSPRAASKDDELLERPAYLPQIPWRLLLVGAVALATVYFGYQFREASRADALRDDILHTHTEQLAPITERYRTFRERIEQWTLEAARGGEPERWSDPRLRIAGLGSGEGLYLRVRAEDATSAEGITRAALAMEPDALTRCLGIAPASARGLYENGAFLMPDWVETVRAEHDTMRLRVLDEQLARSMAVDVPIVASLLRAQYFLLVIQQGDNRRDAPVDVFLWDLRENRQLLRTRIQAHGVLIPVRIDRLLPGVQVQNAPGAPTMTSGGAHDCSIAAQIKAITGDSAVEVGSSTVQALTAELAADAAPTAEGAASEGTASEGAASEGTTAEGTANEGAASEGTAGTANEGAQPTAREAPSGAPASLP